MKSKSTMMIADAGFLLSSLVALLRPILADEGAGELFRASSGESRSDDLFFLPHNAYVFDPEQQQQYGAMHSPSLNLLARQQSKCSLPVQCAGNTCCPAGTSCCAAYLQCCPSESNCRTEFGGACCPKTAQTCGGKFCAVDGSVCCGDTMCAAGFECNTLGGIASCCRPGELKCRGGCCPAGSQCAAVAGSCLSESLSESLSTLSVTRTVTSSLALTLTSEVIELTTRVLTFSFSLGRSQTLIETRVDTITRAITLRSIDRELSTAARPSKPDRVRTTTSTPSPSVTCPPGSDGARSLLPRPANTPDCDYECHNGRPLPVVTFDDIPGMTDQLIVSMCSGILATSGGRGGDGVNFDILTYAGPFGKKARRGKAGCKGYCAEQALVFSDPALLQCDEYPPAMANEGGNNAHRTCIPRNQNQGVQSKVLRQFVRIYKPRQNDPFVLRIRGGCALRNSRAKRRILSAHFLSKRQGVATIFDASSDQLRTIGTNVTYVYVPVADLQSGSYKFDMNYNPGGGEAIAVQRVEVLDSDGDVYFSSERPVNGQIVFDVKDIDEDDPVPAGLIVDTSHSVNVSYSATASLVDNSTGSAYRGLSREGRMKWDWILALATTAGIIVFV